jgi:hypothetical protein
MKLTHLVSFAVPQAEEEMILIHLNQNVTIELVGRSALTDIGPANVNAG